MEKRLKLRTADKEEFGIARKDAFSINPLKIIVDFNTNPREYYGTEEEQEEWENSVKIHGVKMPVSVKSKDGKFYLTHGFRRMKAVLANLKRGVNIESIPVLQVEDNDEQILIDHIILNEGKPFTDNELAKTLNQISTLMGRDDFAEISRRVGIHQVKVGTLIRYARTASSQVKDSVKSGEMAISTAVNLIKKVSNITEQNEALNLAREAKEDNGDKKIKTQHIRVLGAPKNNETSIVRLRLLTIEALTFGGKDMDKEFTQRVLNLINSVSGTNTLEDKEVLELFNVPQELA